jgi:hypothetical protein
MQRRLLSLVSCLAVLSVVSAQTPPTTQSTDPDKPADRQLLKDKTMRTMLTPFAVTTQAIAKTSQFLLDRIDDNTLGVRQVFDTVVPGGIGDKNLVLDVEPKLGDFVRKQYVRVPFELRYGLPFAWEVYGGLTPVFPNPLKAGEDHRWSPGLGKLGLRRDFNSEAFFFEKVVVGFETLSPLGEPPVALIDHYVHLRPYVTGLRSLESSLPHTTLLLSLLYDQAVSCPQRSGVPAGVIKTEMTEIAPGLLYQPSQFGYFLQYGFRYYNDTKPSGQRTGNIGKIGMIWDMPRERSVNWGLPGKWQFEFGVSSESISQEANNTALFLRARWKIDLKRKSKP